MSYILVEHPRPHVTLITLNRPERMNAMAFDVMVPLRATLETVGNDNDCRVVIITGAGSGFCSGADLENAGIPPHIDGLTVTTIAQRAMELLDDVIVTISKLHQPVIGAINGAAIGGGFCLAMATDIRVAAPSAYFRAAGINNGLTASELGISYLLPRAIGSSRAFDIMLTGRDVLAEEADRIGLVSHIAGADELLDDCYAIAERMIGFSRIGSELTKRMLWSSLDAGSLRSHMDHDALHSCMCGSPPKIFKRPSRPAKKNARPYFATSAEIA